MKIHHLFIVYLLLFMLPSLRMEAGSSRPQDIYLVIYITKTGYTGHVGIAVDNYRIVGKDTLIGKNVVTLYDTVKNYSLTYFDLWGPPEITWDQHDTDLPSRYFKLPKSSSERRITPDYFLTKGLPHSYDYPCDALVRIRTSPSKDYALKDIAESIQTEKPYFNSRQYNCTDYVILCLNRLFNTKLEATEFIPFSWSSTPNKFYQELVANFKVDLIKKAGPEVTSSFFKERIINTTFFNNN